MNKYGIAVLTRYKAVPPQAIDLTAGEFSAGTGRNRNRTRSTENIENRVRARPPDAGPLKKRSPGTAGTAAGTNRKARIKSHSKTTKNAPAPQEPDRQLAVYDGRVLRGSITGSGKHFRVVLPTAVVLGSFATLKQALAAIRSAHA